MKNINYEKIKYLFFKHSKLIIALLTMLLIILIFLLFKTSYSSRNLNEFDEIQNNLDAIYIKDKNLYNKTKVELIKKEAKGIDISSWQGKINWDKISQLDIDFIMIRCGLRGQNSPKISEDKYFHQNIREANRLGIPVGVYFYSTAIEEIEAIEEASYVINQIKDYKITYPIVYDFEIFNKHRAVDISDEVINNNALTFLKYIEKHGYKGMLYSNLTNLKYHWNTNLFNDYHIWYAQYADTKNSDIEYDMWQYADNGHIDGIKGKVDLNTSYITYQETE